MDLRRLSLAEMEQAARVFRASFDDRLPWLSGLHTPDEDRSYFEGQLFSACEVWGALESRSLVGIVAFRQGWIDQLYVEPGKQGRGFGGALLELARLGRTSVSLWTFQRNEGARCFYERRGCVPIKETDGSGNEEREPDVLYRWTAPGCPNAPYLGSRGQDGASTPHLSLHCGRG